jgi:hypothetical protein
MSTASTIAATAITTVRIAIFDNSDAGARSGCGVPDPDGMAGLMVGGIVIVWLESMFDPVKETGKTPPPGSIGKEDIRPAKFGKWLRRCLNISERMPCHT